MNFSRLKPISGVYLTLKPVSYTQHQLLYRVYEVRIFDFIIFQDDSQPLVLPFLFYNSTVPTRAYFFDLSCFVLTPFEA